MSDTQEYADRFYWSHGKCCAGCDHWRHFNVLAGECTRSAPISSDERAAMLGIDRSSLSFGAGHAMTRNNHVCGDFADSFDWLALPISYLARIGAPIAKLRSERAG